MGSKEDHDEVSFLSWKERRRKHVGKETEEDRGQVREKTKRTVGGRGAFEEGRISICSIVSAGGGCHSEKVLNLEA